MDPYKVLGVTQQSSDDDIKRAYRELARKYHPDNYVNNPLADLAEARMKEINEAYDQVMAERSGSRQSGYTQSSGYAQGQTGGYQSNYGGQAYGAGRSSVFGPVRAAINAGNLSYAEELLNQNAQRPAEWYFLMGTIYYRKGWYDEAARCYQQAVAMEPANPEYRSALNMVNMAGAYGGYRPMQQSDLCDCCANLICLSLCCNCCHMGC